MKRVQLLARLGSIQEGVRWMVTLCLDKRALFWCDSCHYLGICTHIMPCIACICAACPHACKPSMSFKCGAENSRCWLWWLLTPNVALHTLKDLQVRPHPASCCLQCVELQYKMSTMLTLPLHTYGCSSSANREGIVPNAQGWKSHTVLVANKNSSGWPLTCNILKHDLSMTNTYTYT